MLKRIKLEKLAGVVALSYLALIPIGAYYTWKRTQAIESDIAELWDKTGITHAQAEVPSLLGMVRGLRTR